MRVLAWPAARPPRLLLAGGIGLGLVLLLAWAVGLVWFARHLPSAVADPARRTDAIVVLTGGQGRLRQGLDLLSARKADKLFVSGVHRGVEAAQLLEISRRAPEELACCVTLGYEADDTHGNAMESARWIGEQGFRSLRLVTATYHMPRGLLEFRRAMPEIEIVPHPVFSPRFKQEDWWRWPGSASLLATEYSKYLLAFLGAR